mgnify:CR=1 FL=1
MQKTKAEKEVFFRAQAIKLEEAVKSLLNTAQQPLSRYSKQRSQQYVPADYEVSRKGEYHGYHTAAGEPFASTYQRNGSPGRRNDSSDYSRAQKQPQKYASSR